MSVEKIKTTIEFGDGCHHCRGREFTLHDFIYTLVIICNECGSKYTLFGSNFGSGEIRYTVSHGGDETVKKIEL